MLKPWNEIPEWMRTPEVKQYYDILSKRKISLLLKRTFDVVVAFVTLIILSPLMAAIAIAISVDSSGGVFYRQVRVTTYGKEFRIHKFRTMVANADKIGTQVTVGNDIRITKVGAFLRKYRLDEIPQLLDIIAGTMTFVGTRPETPKFVAEYSEEMKATLLLPAGVTSETSIRFKDEAELLDAADDVDKVYVEEVLPIKMKYNLESIREFSFFREIVTMVRTVFAVLGKEYK
jgi:lipopolysaccharide/colanic/teichoic acid biosynthesis glycosyltransferase